MSNKRRNDKTDRDEATFESDRKPTPESVERWAEGTTAASAGMQASEDRISIRQVIEDRSEHIAAEKRRRRADILYYLLDVVDRGGVTIGAISSIAVFFPVLPNTDPSSAAELTTRSGEQVTIIVQQALNSSRDTTLAAVGMLTGFTAAFVSSYVKARLTWRGK